MAPTENGAAVHFALSIDGRKPKGILKKTHIVPPTAPPTASAPVEEPDHPLTKKELTILNTQVNAGRRRSSSAARSVHGGLRRQGSRTPSIHGDDGDMDSSQRLKWDEANLYLTEQERTATMKIDEPKTPYVHHYDPAEDPSDNEGEDDDMPGLSLGEPEEAVPEMPVAEHRATKVHVDENNVHRNGKDGDDEDDALAGMSAEEREKHHRFELLRKKHYEMRNVAKFLGHPEDLEDKDDEDEDENSNKPPPLPTTET